MWVTASDRCIIVLNGLLQALETHYSKLADSDHKSAHACNLIMGWPHSLTELWEAYAEACKVFGLIVRRAEKPIVQHESS